MWLSKRALFRLAGLALFSAAVAAQAADPPGLAQTLRRYQGQKRVLLLGAPTASQAELKRQQQLLAAVPDQLQARDLVVLELPYDQLPPADRQYWHQQLGQSLTHFAVVLLGKDGGVKRRSAQPLPPAELFDTIDKMPMRQQEMRRKPE